MLISLIQPTHHPSLGGIHVVNHYHDPTMCEYELGLQRMHSTAHRTMPVGPFDTERTRSSLVAGVVDHVWELRSQCCLARISKRL